LLHIFQYPRIENAIAPDFALQMALNRTGNVYNPPLSETPVRLRSGGLPGPCFHLLFLFLQGWS
jgi:hypothetical protein